MKFNIQQSAFRQSGLLTPCALCKSKIRIHRRNVENTEVLLWCWYRPKFPRFKFQKFFGGEYPTTLRGMIISPKMIRSDFSLDPPLPGLNL